VPDPSRLLAVARLLAASDADEVPSEEQLRRAVSTAYYALFHAVLRAGANRFVGEENENRPGYGLIYRGFNHTRMKAVCAALDVARLSPSLQRQLGITVVSQHMREFASDFVALQEARNRADYDPRAEFFHSDTVSVVAQAELALRRFERAAADERIDILALMLAGARD
jgi:uncharacterized protein (UPF0332 family)